MNRVTIVCCIPEIGEEANRKLADQVVAATPDANPTIIIGRQASASRVLAELQRAADFLSEGENRRAFFYYNGHGDQILDRNRDERDGRDEIWKPAVGRIIDDEITEIVSKIPKDSSNLFVLISDSCSSGSMIDEQCDGNWVSFGSCQDPQNSLASSEGGIFTIFSLLPFLKSRTKPFTMEELADFTRLHISVPSQKFSLLAGRPELASWPVFV